MGRHQKKPLRMLTEEEKSELKRIASSNVERVERIRRSRALLAVAEGQSFTQAARTARMHSSSGVAAVVQRFHDRGLAALDTLPGAGRHPIYSPAQRALVLIELEREMEKNPFASLAMLEQALRRVPAGVPRVSAKTIAQVLRDAGYNWDPEHGAWLKENKDSVVMHEPQHARIAGD